EEGGVGVEARAAELASVVVRISVLGQFSLERREDAQQTASSLRWQPITDATLQHQRVRSLLTCLINSPGRKIGREQAIDLLWPDLDFETASHRLDKAVHSLRQALEPGRSRPATSTLLLTEHATLQLADQSRIWIDADAFESLLAQARASSDPGLTEQLLEEAALLYGGDYLPDERGLDWTQARRESLQRGWIGLLLELADLRIAREAITSAIDTLDRLLAIDATNEAAVQRLIVLLVQSGRRGEALRIYQRFAALLKQEYRIAPLPETRALYDSARRGEDTQMRHSPASLTDNLLPAQESARAAEADVRPHMQVGRSNQSQLVGREQEVAALQELLHTTEQTRRLKLAGQKRSAAPLALDARRAPQCVLLMGDVGIGKTRLAEELGRDARRRGWTVTWMRAYAQETSIPYRMWTETLRKAMTQGLWQRQEIARRPLVYQALRALLPELEDLLPPADTTATSPEQEQLRLWEATRALLVTISESAPMLIVLDDLQWSDSSSCELLAYLIRQLRGHPILIAGTCRDIELPQGHPLRSILNDLQREQAVETINVQPLTDDQIRVLVSAHSGLSGLPGLPEPIVRHIQARAAGNPFFAEELARNVESGLTPSDQFPDVRANNRRETALDLQDALPDTISAVLDLRMGRISSACQRLLVRAAVLGGAFEFNTLLAMESGPTALDEDTILDLLEEGLQAGMLTEEGSGTRIT
ncbi:MAG TPA: AAA family ATPase, partial [Ktedonobacteraceae bacterium]|nr:AAA family ATPase [Ktedonobacteraceae bacterium]